MPLTSRSQSCPELLNLEGLGDGEGLLRAFSVATPFKNQEQFLAMLAKFTSEELGTYCQLLKDQLKKQETQVDGAQADKGAERGEPSQDLSVAARFSLASTELQKREAELEAQSAPTPFPLSQ
ncbi:hypothetical protein Psal006b_02722 [Piscirickettsia salmonis]|uniref:Transposase n=1 Tax=Piscirickettsia salmonis TaxID=1238 RepID=A0A1L6TGX2_PISSA|nr:hypothetical protein [Piscirickettsia salmonis]AKP73038.2 hypothetical protein PSLF89_993 [Piscirickettsia salmonis LF-89 = ATCC VR-1361]ALB21678.1 transposase [Piscirickettsia salmonis]ALY01877.1 hypothetical protein AWE47_02495 [Piscirickettsia salmonis]AMA41387.1 hypothetical protein AWJ11_02480 [Piscirickettsia salmonis]AOS36589.1 hypothetical protein AVM72_15470 [Piscirickettsia salmonis]